MLIGDSFLARVRFLATEEGGRRRPPLNPAISQLALPEVQLSCHVVAVDRAGNPLEVGELSLGRTYLVRVVVHHASRYLTDLAALGPEVQFFDGARCVACGVRESDDPLGRTPDSIEQFIAKSQG